MPWIANRVIVDFVPREDLDAGHRREVDEILAFQRIAASENEREKETCYTPNGGTFYGLRLRLVVLPAAVEVFPLLHGSSPKDHGPTLEASPPSELGLFRFILKQCSLLIASQDHLAIQSRY